MTGVFVKRENLDREMSIGRTPCGHEGGDQDELSTSRFPASHRKLGERHEIDSPHSQEKKPTPVIPSSWTNKFQNYSKFLVFKLLIPW